MNIVENCDYKGFYLNNTLFFNIDSLRFALDNHVSKCAYCGMFCNVNHNCKYCGAKTFVSEVFDNENKK